MEALVLFGADSEISQSFCGSSIKYLLAVVDDDYSIHKSCQLRQVVGHDYECSLLPFHETCNHGVDKFCSLSVQVGCRFIQYQDFWMHCNYRCDAQALLLPSRQSEGVDF